MVYNSLMACMTSMDINMLVGSQTNVTLLTCRPAIEFEW